MKSKRFLNILFIVGVIIVLASSYIITSAEKRELVEVSSKAVGMGGSLELISATMTSGGKEALLVFSQDLPFDPEEIVRVTFYEETLSGLTEATFGCSFDWDSPIESNTMIMRLGSLGSFDQLTVRLHRNDKIVRSWTYKK